MGPCIWFFHSANWVLVHSSLSTRISRDLVEIYSLRTTVYAKAISGVTHPRQRNSGTSSSSCSTSTVLVLRIQTHHINYHTNFRLEFLVLILIIVICMVDLHVTQPPAAAAVASTVCCCCSCCTCCCTKFSYTYCTYGWRKIVYIATLSVRLDQ